MEHNTIEREILVDASPATVYEVISRPEHLKEWWPDEAEYQVVPGSPGRIGFGDTWVQFTVVEAVPYERFAFRWTHGEHETAEQGNSLLVVFALAPDGDGTRLTMTESGFDTHGWDEATAAAEYAEHVTGWDFYLPRLPVYAAKAGGHG